MASTRSLGENPNSRSKLSAGVGAVKALKLHFQECLAVAGGFIARFKRVPEDRGRDDVQNAMSTFVRAVTFTPEGCPVKPLRFRNTSTSIHARFINVRRVKKTEVVVEGERYAVELAPDNHSRGTERLYFLSISLRRRLQRLITPEDLDDAINSITRAAKSIPDYHPDKATHLTTLGNLLFKRFRRLGRLQDLDDAISAYCSAVEATPEDHPDKASHYYNLSIPLTARLHRLRNLDDVEDAVEILTRVVNLVSDLHPEKPRCLDILATSTYTRYLRLDRPQDIEDAIITRRRVLDLTPDGHPKRPWRLHNLGVLLQKRFQRTDNLEDLGDAIKVTRWAVELTSTDNPDTPERLAGLGYLLYERFQRIGDLQDIEDAISNATCALELTPDGHPSQPSRYTNLGSSFWARFQRLGDLKDIEASIANHRRALELTPDGHPDQPSQYTSLGNSFWTRFRRLGDLEDLEAAIANERRALELTPDGNPDQHSRYADLGISFRTRFDRLGDLEDLEAAITHERRALELTPDGHPDKALCYADLGDSFKTRFERLGYLEDLEAAIVNEHRALELTPDGHPDQHSRYADLGTSLRTRFGRLGDLDDLEVAIVNERRALELTPDGHPDQALRYASLGNSVRTRFERLGDLEDLDAAIANHRHALELTPDGHPDQPSRYANLGNSFWILFRRFGDLEDLEAAIVNERRALELTPDGHPNQALLYANLGSSFGTRYRQLGDLEDLEAAIANQRHALELTSDGHPDQASRYGNLGASLAMRYQQLGGLEDIEAAIAHQRCALHLTPDGHSDQPLYYLNLSSSFRTRFSQLGSAKDLEDAVELASRAVEIMPINHSMRAWLLVFIGDTFSLRIDSSHSKPTDLVKAAEAYMAAAKQISSNPSERLQAAMRCVDLVSDPSRATITGEMLLQAHNHILELIPRVVWLGYDVRRRYEDLLQYGTLANHAAADTIAAGDYNQAFEWLESGRSIVWAQLLQLRTPLDGLREISPQLAADLEHVSQALQSSHTITVTDSRGGGLSTTTPADHSLSPSLTTPGLMHDTKSNMGLAIKYDSLIAQIRNIEGFESFLRPKKLSQLVPAASSGPVVVVNVHESRCDALILTPSGDVSHVPLPALSYEQAEELREQLANCLEEGGARSRYRDDVPDSDAGDPGDDRYFRQRRHGRARKMSICDILATLWTAIVKPITDTILSLALPEHTLEGGLIRITWCPTGPLVFLPLHAAGIYSDDQPRQSVMNIAVSSYTPTLEALLKPRGQTSLSRDSHPSVLVVAQASAPGHNLIPMVKQETKLVRSLFSEHITVLEDSQGTIDAVLQGMDSHPWIHLACHGTQAQTATESAFILHDGRLELSRLMTKSLPNAELAFLSACQTATGDTELPQEAVHLAAGMLNAGYRSVVGTMWSIKDSDAPVVAETFYEVVKAQMAVGKELDSARALHEATKRLRDEVGEERFLRWVPFVHFGV